VICAVGRSPASAAHVLPLGVLALLAACGGDAAPDAPVVPPRDATVAADAVRWSCEPQRPELPPSTTAAPTVVFDTNLAARWPDGRHAVGDGHCLAGVAARPRRSSVAPDSVLPLLGMKLEDVEPVTTLKRDAAELIERATRRRTPIVITQNGRPTAVLQDARTYAADRDAFALLALALQGEREIVERGGMSAAAHARRMRALLRKPRRP
jgi:prevent-host-death family protein